MSWVAFAVGLFVVATVLADVFRTVLLPRPAHHLLRIAPLLGSVVAPPWLWLSRQLRSAQRRQTFRGGLGPMLLVLTLLIWVLLLFLGFGLMLFGVRDQVDPPVGFGDGLYYAASAFLTLGISPASAHGLARVIAVAAGLVGLAVVTVLVTFILSVQSEITRREVLVLRTQVSAGQPPTGVALLETYARIGMADQLAGTFREWEVWAADVLHSHRANPILMHFRSADENGEWLAMFGAVMDAATFLLATIQHEKLEAGVSAARLFTAMGTRTLVDLAALFELRPEKEFADPGDISSEVRSARQHLARLAYPVVADESGCVSKVSELLTQYQPHLTALCRHLDIVTSRTLIEVNEPRAKAVTERTKQS